ncbi:phosphotransferase family protein [Pseudomonas umsongensis]|uniref:phosphotransferase family protein n=1 Tax=Pseudomonas umsongensis TaxID=198618 RepID=UPI00200B1381|nr:phosphotransferase family protein [Pseudomonas umsongensis]MCK8683336.1 phosphotransferase family protein [Pseudomonas umsongensis]
MNDSNLKYLRAINQQLGGAIGQAVGDGMAGRLLFCTANLLRSLIAEQQGYSRPVGDTTSRIRDLTPQLRDMLGDSNEVCHLLDTLENSAVQEQHFFQALAAVAGLLAGRQDNGSKSLLAEFVAWDQQRWTGVEHDFNALSLTGEEHLDREVEPITADELERLKTLLRQHCGEGPGLQVSHVNAIAGGFSKQTIILTLEGNQHLPNEIVMRRDRAESPVGSTVLDEFQLLKTLHAAGVCVPQPFVVDASGVMGCPILIMAKAAGGNIGDVYNIHAPSTLSTELATGLARELAKLHQVSIAQLPSSLPGTDSSHKAFLRQEMEKFQRDWLALDQSSVTITVAFEWLFAHLDLLGDRRCLVHGDTRFHNILCQGDQVTAILDWELAAIGNPARDLGYAYHHIIQFADWQQFLDAYRDAGGTVPSALELDFYILWSDLFVAIYMYRARESWLSSSGDNIQLAYAGERLRQHNMQLLSTRLNGLLAKYSVTQ